MRSITTPGPEMADPASTRQGKVKKKAGKRVGYNYIIIKSLKESQKNDVVKCLYIKSLTNFGYCVIKEGTYGDTKDHFGRDIKDRLIWQKQLHEVLQDKVKMPRLLGSFEENGNYYLVMECIKGKSLNKTCFEERRHLRTSMIMGNKLAITFSEYLLQIIDILDTLHQHQVVHRDVTANNFMITAQGKVAIIDMELSYSLIKQFPSPPFQLGTYGYMSPEQEATHTPTVKEDIFSLGAIILLVWSGVSPGKLTNTPINELTGKLQFFIPDQQIADIVTQCLDPDPDKRPALSTIREILQQYKIDQQKKIPRISSQPSPSPGSAIKTAIQETINTLATPLLADPEKGWFSDVIKPLPNGDRHKITKNWYASFNRGASGIIYMLCQARKTGYDINATLPYIQKGIELIKEKYISRIEQVGGGLHFGADGVAVSLAAAIQQGLVSSDAEFPEWIDLLFGKSTERPSITRGVAGQGIAGIICEPFLSPSKNQALLDAHVQHLLRGQQHEGHWVHTPLKNKKGRTIYGFANGMAGTIYFLLEYARRYQNTDAMDATSRGLKWLIKKAVKKRESIYWLSSKGKELHQWWGDGAAGIALTFIKAYQITGNPDYKHYATLSLRRLPPNIIDNNLSQYNGLSGLGEVYLEAHRIFGEEEWLQRADWITQVIMHFKKTHPLYGTYWLVEQERHPVANFMIGNSGILHFLLRFLAPDSIGFPLLV